MASNTKHRERSMRRHAQKESAKNWFFTSCGRFAYGQSSNQGTVKIGGRII